MSQFRKPEIVKAFTDWANSGRYTAPNSFKGNETAEKAELEALIGVVLKMAPHSDYKPWLAQMFDRLESHLKVRIWPNKNELGAVCSNLNKDMPRPATAAPTRSLEPAAINADRMLAGEAVGEEWLYGTNAVELIASRRISQDLMQKYRSAAYFARKDLYGDEAAATWESERKAAHEIAREAWSRRDEQPSPRNLPIPDKRMSQPNWGDAA